jgi:hypothetical protein
MSNRIDITAGEFTRTWDDLPDEVIDRVLAVIGAGPDTRYVVYVRDYDARLRRQVLLRRTDHGTGTAARKAAEADAAYVRYAGGGVEVVEE